MPLTADTSEPLLITGTPGVTDMTFRQLRQLAQAVDGKGAMSPTDLLVSAPGGMNVQVAAGYAWIPGTTITGPEGQHRYGVPITAAKTLGAVTAPVGATRRDSVVLRVYDEGDAPGSGLNVGRVEYRINPVESLTAEALPANAILLAYVDVTVGAGAITSGMITDRRWLVSSPVPLVTTLPLNPYDGQVIDLQTTAMATDGIVWRFRYRAASASAYKWEAVGSNVPWQSEKDATESSSIAVFGNFTPAPTVTTPVAGDYYVEQGGNHYNNSVGAATLLSYAVGAAAALDADAMTHQTVSGVNIGSQFRRRRKNAIASGAQIVEKVRVSAGTGTWRDRSIAIVPIRVG